MKAFHACFAAALLLAGTFAFAQQPPHDTDEDIYACTYLTSGVHTMYPTDQPAPTPAPEGYKPFYISHIGRHGARYPLGETVYTDILDTFKDAQARGFLTPEGEEFLRVYSEFYPKVAHREGELTLKGQEQHRQIIRQMYRDYPEVFAGPTRAEAISTASHRVIVSMYTFLTEARILDPDFTYTADYGKVYLPVLLPGSHESTSYITPDPVPDEVKEATRKFNEEIVDSAEMLSLWFNRVDSLKMKPYDLLKSMHVVYSTFTNIDMEVPQALWTMFSYEDRAKLWERDNYRWYQKSGLAPGIDNRNVLQMKNTVRDFIDKASSDWKDGIALRLRFSHDSALAPLMSYMNVNGMGAVVADPHQVKHYWRTFDITMACNFQIIFFRRSADDDDILIQVLLNGFEAELPFEHACPGFYSWKDFLNYYQ